MKYRTIVIDPPWDLGALSLKLTNFKFKKSLPYKTMTLQEIEDFPIGKYAAWDCQLFMWCTLTTLPDALRIVRKWNFKYHVLITWDKTKGLSLFGFNRRTEFCIFAYQGALNIKQRGSSIPTLIKECSTVHSAKPRIFYDFLLRNTPEPRIDIFSRRKHIGFDSLGDQSEEPLTLGAFMT